MTLEQRVEALEKALDNLTLPNSKTEELAKMMRDVATETIKNVCLPGGMLKKNVNQEAATLMAAKLATSKLLAEQAK